MDEKELEELHAAGYERDPAKPGEFDIPEDDHAWGDKPWCAVDRQSSARDKDKGIWLHCTPTERKQ